MTFRTINLKRGIKHVFLVLDTTLHLGDAPFIVLGTVCTGNVKYLFQDFGDGVFAKPPPENPTVQVKVIAPCPFLFQLPYVCGLSPLYPSLEPPVALCSPSSLHTSFDVLFSRFSNHGPYALCLDSYNT